MVHLDGVTHQVHRHVGGDDLVTPDDEEVDVGDDAAHRVALDVTGQGEVACAVDLEVEQRIETGVARDGLAELSGDHRHGDGVGAMSVDDPGDPPRRPQAARRTRPWFAAGLGDERDLGHGVLLGQCRRSRVPDGLRSRWWDVCNGT